MKQLKQLFGKSALAAVAVSFATAAGLYADTGSGGSCSDAGGTITCQSGTPCCIYGNDSTGTNYSVHTCCTGGKTCKTKYQNGTYGTGPIDPTREVDTTGCL